MKKKFNWWWLLIIGVAIFGRFFDFDNRWVLNQDQARDAIIGLYAWGNNTAPEIGSPSSAGPFNFGPWYHWIIMVFEKLLPGVKGPWIGFGLLSVLATVVYAKIGQALYGMKGMIIFGLIAGLAVGQVQNAPDMLNTVIVGVSGVVALWTGLKLIKTEKIIWMIATGFFVGLSINFHFQALGTLSWLLAIVVVNKFDFKKRVGWAIGLGSGLVMAFLPLIIFDIKRGGIWIKSVVEYYTVGVNKFYVPVRWLTEIRDFWPQLFGDVVVGEKYFGYFLIILIILLVITNFKLRISNLRKIDRFWWVVIFSFLIEVLLMRNYKGVRSREYLIAFHSIIILIFSWITVEYFKLNKFVGGLILGIIIVTAGVNNWNNITKYPSQAKIILEIKKELDNKFEGKVNIENYEQSDMASLPLFYLYYFENRIGEGKNLAVCDGNRYACPGGEIINKNNYRIYEGKSLGGNLLTDENIYRRLWVNYGF